MIITEPKLTIILPTRNEVEAIGQVLNDIRSLPVSCRVLVVDTESTDGTLEVCKQYGIEVINESRRGKGIATATAFKNITTPYALIINSDYTYPIEYAPLVLHILERTGCGMVMGCRLLNERGSMSALNSLGNWGLSLMASIFYGHRIYDLCTGMKAFRKDVVKRIVIKGEGFNVEADLLAQVCNMGERIEQIPIAYRKRLGKSRSKLNWLAGFGIGWFMVKERWNAIYTGNLKVFRNPLFLLLICGLAGILPDLDHIISYSTGFEWPAPIFGRPLHPFILFAACYMVICDTAHLLRRNHK